MKKSILVFTLMVLFCLNLSGQTNGAEQTTPPLNFKLVFHKIGYNALHSVIYNYGANFLGAGLVTYGFIETGFDLYWRNLSYNNSFLPTAGLPFIYIGFPVPVLTPLVVFLVGRSNRDVKLQITAAALTQSLALTLALNPLKMMTGRANPEIVDVPTNRRGLATDDKSKTFNWFSMEFFHGWPSGHTAFAFSAAATLTEMYKDNLWLKIGLYTYAALMGLGVSVNVHWISDSVAAALMGYAIGKTVGRTFSRLLENKPDDNKLSFFATHNTIGVTIRF